MAFDAIPYVDMLLRDLGLDWRRKVKVENAKETGFAGWRAVKAWWREVFWPYGPGDYIGLVDEWRATKES